VKVLVVDDSSLYRTVLRDVLSNLKCVAAVETASDGLEALSRIKSWGPDVITLDVDMPGMSGLKVLRELRAEGHRQPVIVVSSLTDQGTAVAALVLEHDATHVLAKPQAGGREALSRFEQQLRQVIEDLARSRRRLSGFPTGPAAAGSSSRLRVMTVTRPRVIAIGASTGGPAVLSTIIGRLPGDLAVPIVVALHLPAGFSRPLAEQLGRRGALRVVEVEDGMRPAPGIVYVAPGGRQTRLVAGPTAGSAQLSVTDSPAESACRPSADVLFDSVADVHGGRAVGIVLTGMGRDGVTGLQRMKSKGAAVLVQDEASSVVFGMPAAVIAAGLADVVASPEALADHIIAFAQRRT
jgi:two-component system, chemotaxis family, protein-glutamate methylesterase/glutaminase